MLAGEREKVKTVGRVRTLPTVLVSAPRRAASPPLPGWDGPSTTIGTNGADLNSQGK